MAKRSSLPFRNVFLAGIGVLLCGSGFAQSPGGAPSADAADKLPSRSEPTTKPFLLEQIFERSETWSETLEPQFRHFARWYRDSRGRTRIQEKDSCATVQLMGMRPSDSSFLSMVRIADPRTGVGYRWDGESREAHTVPAAEIQTILKPNPWERTFKTGEDGIGLCAPPSPDESVAPLDVKHESLGERNFEGVLLRGTWDTMTMPAGWMGSNQPAKRTCETWTSPDLGMVLISDCTDLVTGTTRTRLVHVSFSEPDPSLFQIPEGFKIVTEPPVGRKGHKAPAL